jgi:hypothetical protein
MPIILVTQQSEIRRMVVQSPAQAKGSKDPISTEKAEPSA